MGNIAPREQKKQLLWLQQSDASSLTWLVNSYYCKTEVTLTAMQAARLSPDGQLVLGYLSCSHSNAPEMCQMYPITGISGPFHRALLLLHHKVCAAERYPLLCELWGYLDSLPPGPLWDFYYQVLADEMFIQGFFKARASHHHHHQHEGGLLEHSHEVAKTSVMLAMQHNLSPQTVAIAFLGGLLHDAGKIYLYYNQPVGEGVCAQHEALNFMCLQQQLDQLRQRAPRMFEALCGCLTQTNRYTASYLPETIVKMADRLSAEVCNWRLAFANTPSFYWYRKSPNDQRIYKRLGS